MKKYGVMIVGTGWVSGEHIRAFEMSDKAEIRAIVSRDYHRGRAKSNEYNLGDKCKIYTNYDEALEDPNIDIVVICTPNNMHCEQTIKAAAAHKHILIEKPLALSWEDSLRMRDAVNKAGVKTLVGYVLHYNPLFMAAKKLQKDFIGKLFYAETDYFHRVTSEIPCYEWTCKKSVGGSSLLAGGCHAVDAMRWFMEDEVTSVYAQTCRLRNDLEFEGTIAIILKFKNGAVAKIGSSYDFISPYIFNVHLCGDKGTLWNDKLWSPYMIPEQNDYVHIPVDTPNSGDVKHHPFPEQALHFIDCIENNKETNCSIDDALKTQEIVFAADQSALTGQVVHLPLKQHQF
jgi:predicted dehydrogenase